MYLIRMKSFDETNAYVIGLDAFESRKTAKVSGHAVFIRIQSLLS